jgi:type IV pilus assembly protein PilB
VIVTGTSAPNHPRIDSIFGPIAPIEGEMPESTERNGAETEPGLLAATVTPQGARGLAELHHVPLVDLRSERIDKIASDAIPMRVLARATAVPYRLEGDRLLVALADPADVQAIDELRLATRYSVEIAVASREDIELELQRIARTSEFNERAALIEEDAPLDDEESADLEAEDGISDAPPIRLVNSIILQAAEDGASDVHFLPQGRGLVVKVRLDGVMHEIERIPERHTAGVITRVKVLAKLDIAEHRKPQDGRISIGARTAGRSLDVRVAVLPTVGGEGVIMRLLDKSRRPPTLTEIGLSNDVQMALEQIIHRPTGALLVTGPTGSGKSTTLYAALDDVRRTEINIITIEDPVEYRVEDVYQMQVNARAGVTFATALRAILRSDPDVVMVGEIRDLETAKISLEAALTGHFVFSTMHTNDAPGAIARLHEMGIEPFVVASAVTAVLAQRLVRRLCVHCREPFQATAAELADSGFPPELIRGDEMTLYRKRGCERCSKGFKGRVGVYQLMEMTENLRKLASAGADREALERCAIENGMQTLWNDGIAKVAEGLTTIEELERVLG